jgi:hypothetical protein
MSQQIQAIKQLAGNDLCHYSDGKAEVNRMTHYALRA